MKAKSKKAIVKKVGKKRQTPTPAQPRISDKVALRSTGGEGYTSDPMPPAPALLEINAVAIEPDTVAIHVRTEPAHIANLMSHAKDPKTFSQKLADFFK